MFGKFAMVPAILGLAMASMVAYNTTPAVKPVYPEYAVRENMRKDEVK